MAGGEHPLTASDPATAYGWTVAAHDLTHPDGHIVVPLGRAPIADLARCIEDAATLAEIRQLVAEWEQTDQRYADLVRFDTETS